MIRSHSPRSMTSFASRLQITRRVTVLRWRRDRDAHHARFLGFRTWAKSRPHNPPNQRRPTNDPRRIDAKPEKQSCTDNKDRQSDPVHHGGSPQLPGHYRHQSQRPNDHSIQYGRRQGRTPNLWNHPPAYRDEYKSRDEDAHRSYRRSRYSGNQVANEGSGGEHRPGSELPHSDRINQLLFGKPMQMVDEFRPQKREQHVSAAEHDRPDFQERKK